MNFSVISAKSDLANPLIIKSPSERRRHLGNSTTCTIKTITWFLLRHWRDRLTFAGAKCARLCCQRFHEFKKPAAHRHKGYLETLDMFKEQSAEKTMQTRALWIVWAIWADGATHWGSLAVCPRFRKWRTMREKNQVHSGHQTFVQFPVYQRHRSQYLKWQAFHVIVNIPEESRYCTGSYKELYSVSQNLIVNAIKNIHRMARHHDSVGIERINGGVFQSKDFWTGFDPRYIHASQKRFCQSW